MPNRRHVLASLAAALPGAPPALAAQSSMERPFRILSIDGGGIKGLIPARILENLDLRLRAAGKPCVAESFDLFAGTSTGCIIAAALAQGPPYDVPKVIRDFYYQKGPEIFRKHAALWKRLQANPFDWSGPSYDNDIKAGILDTVFGNKRLSALSRNFIGTFYSLRRTPPGAAEGAGFEELPRAVIARGGTLFPLSAGDVDYRLQDVVLASTSAPIYFEPARVAPSADVAVDGGLFANNPALIAYLEAAEALRGSTRLIEVVSIGCGATPIRFARRLKSWGPLEWADPGRGLPILRAMMDSQASATDQILARQLGNRYVRLQPKAERLGAMDDASPENLANLTMVADTFVTGAGAKLMDSIVAGT